MPAIFVVKLMEPGVLPFTKVGKPRRVVFKDPDACHNAQKKSAIKALQKLADSAQESDIGS